MGERNTAQKILEVSLLVFLIALVTSPFVYLISKYGTVKELIIFLLTITIVSAPFIWVHTK